jgi:hypothetical protein
MYFAVGSPRAISSRVAEVVDDIAGLESYSIVCILRCKKFFACISSHSVSLWLTQPEVEVSRATRGAETIGMDGANVDAVFRPDGTQLVVLTNKGFLHFYLVEYSTQPMLSPTFTKTHHYEKAPGGTYCRAKLTKERKIGTYQIKFRMAIEIDIGTQCGVGLQNEVIICTTDPPSLVSLDWQG